MTVLKFRDAQKEGVLKKAGTVCKRYALVKSGNHAARGKKKASGCMGKKRRCLVSASSVKG